MPVLTSHVDPNGETYRANRAAQLAVLDELGKQLELAIAGGGERYQQRHRDRGRLLARERIELLVDPDSPFLELSALAAWGTGFTVGATVVTGIGVISGVECVIIAHDPTVRGGAMNPYSLRKTLRALEIARTNRLPVMNLVESGGADLPTQADLFVPAGRIFHELTELSANAVPTVALVFGNSTAGGAYVPGMCDYSVLVDGQAKVFLGGPPLVKMATGEESDDESLGGAEMHSRVSGLSDYFAVDEHDAIRIGRDIMARINWRKHGPPPGPAMPPRYDPDEILGIVSADVKFRRVRCPPAALRPPERAHQRAGHRAPAGHRQGSGRAQGGPSVLQRRDGTRAGRLRRLPHHQPAHRGERVRPLLAHPGPGRPRHPDGALAGRTNPGRSAS